jgi:hypothetical protein
MTARRSIASVYNFSNGKGALVVRRSTARANEQSRLQEDNETTTHRISQCKFSKRKLNPFQSVLLCIPPNFPIQVSLFRHSGVCLERTLVYSSLLGLDSIH